MRMGFIDWGAPALLPLRNRRESAKRASTESQSSFYYPWEGIGFWAKVAGGNHGVDPRRLRLGVRHLRVKSICACSSACEDPGSPDQQRPTQQNPVDREHRKPVLAHPEQEPLHHAQSDKEGHSDADEKDDPAFGIHGDVSGRGSGGQGGLAGGGGPPHLTSQQSAPVRVVRDRDE